MSKKSIDVNFPPKSTLYLSHLIATSLMDDMYLFNNYIQLTFDSKNVNKAFDYYPSGFNVYGWPIVPVTALDDKIFEIPQDSVLSTLIKWIDSDYCISIKLPEVLIPGTFFYKSKIEIKDIFTYLHDFFIYGYDCKKSVFKSIHFANDKSVKKIDISFRDFEHAFNSKEMRKALKYRNKIYPSGKKFDLILYSTIHKDKFKCSFDLKRVIFQIKSFIGSIPSDNFSYGYEPDTDKVWGLNVYLKLSQIIADEDSMVFDLRIFYGILEHKKIMKDRLTYIDENIIKIDFLQEFDDIVRLCEKLNTISIKTSISKNLIYKEKLSSLLKEIHDKEKSFLEKILVKLENI